MSQSLSPTPSAFEAGIEAAFAARSKTNETQEAAFAQFSKSGLPNRKQEGWKWSDFNAVLRNHDVSADSAGEAAISVSPFSALNPIEFRIVDGKIILPDETMPDGVRWGVIDTVGTIPELERHPIANLNVAMTRKALGIEVGENISVERPVLIRHIINNPGFGFAQTLMRVSVDAQVNLIETYEGKGVGLYSHLFHTVVRDGAQLDRIALQEVDGGAVVHGVCAAKVDGRANFNQHTLSTGSRLSRHETHVHFWGDHASAQINSAALLSGERHSDFTSEVLFKAENCTARQLHKGVANERGRNIFQGKFNVERKAQKTDAQMAANALLLSEGAEANHKPELEIYADDVECAHGSTVGALDEEALFYLRQRGLTEEAARSLLVEAFVGEVVDSMKNDELRSVFAERVRDWLVRA